MPTRIRALHCLVRVRSGTRDVALHRDERPPRPALEFAMPVAGTAAESLPLPSESASEERGPAAGKAAVSASQTDPGQVADRVYELIKQEVRLGLQRGEPL